MMALVVEPLLVRARETEEVWRGMIAHASVFTAPWCTTGKRHIAVRQNVFRALFIRRTANVVFAVRFSDDARQTKMHGIHILCRAFLGGAQQSQIFVVRFPRDARQFFYTNVWPSQPSWPAVRADGRQPLSCALEQRTTKTTSLPCLALPTELTGRESWRASTFVVRLRTTHGKDNKFAVHFHMAHSKVTTLPCVLHWCTTMYF
jgi:hypothetical protein